MTRAVAMPDQPSLLDMMRGAPIIRPVDPLGEVIQGDPDEVLRLKHSRLAWDITRIELHQHSDGLWMWSVSCAGGGYRVGPKWGKFAATRDDALHHAAQELIEKMRGKLARADAGCGQIITPAQMRQAIAWAEGLA